MVANLLIKLHCSLVSLAPRLSFCGKLEAALGADGDGQPRLVDDRAKAQARLGLGVSLALSRGSLNPLIESLASFGHFVGARASHTATRVFSVEEALLGLIEQLKSRSLAFPLR